MPDHRASGAFVNARVWPMRGPTVGPEPWREEHQAILWLDGRVRLVGSDAAVREEAGRHGVEPQDAGGRILVPGFVDAHTHFLHIGVKRHRPDLSAATSLEDLLARVAGWLREHPGTEPVIGERWDEAAWPIRERPTRGQLDAVVAQASRDGAGPPDRPVVLRRVCGHVAVANSAALAPIRRRWDSDALVQPESGHLFEDASLYLNEVLGTSPALLGEALAEATAECLALGITTVGDYSQSPYRAALTAADAAGRLGIRVASSIYPQQLADAVAQGFRTGQRHGTRDRLRDGGLKVFLDGSLGAHTAALREPYEDSKAHAHHHDPSHGMLNWSDAEATQWFRQADAAGVQVHAHAIGDAAIDQGLRAFSSILPARGVGPGVGQSTQTPTVPVGTDGGPNPLRHRFEHFEIAHDEQMRATARLGVVSSSQPNFVGTWSAKGGMYEERLGPRFALNNRFRTMLAAGVRVAFGSDGMPPGPLQGIRAACQHPIPSERLAPQEAVWHYTWWSAWSLHWEDEVGSLEAGKAADLVLLDGADPAGWKVYGTWLGGEKTGNQA